MEKQNVFADLALIDSVIDVAVDLGNLAGFWDTVSELSEKLTEMQEIDEETIKTVRSLCDSATMQLDSWCIQNRIGDKAWSPKMPDPCTM